MVRATGGGRKGGKSTLPSAPAHEALVKIDPPDELRDDNALAIWQTQSRVLMDRKLLTIDHGPLLLAYCNSFSLYLEAEQAIIDEGLTVFSAKGGPKKNPSVNVRQDALASMVRIGSLLGLDPLSIRRMTGGGSGDKDGNENEFSEFL
ncbi:TPA: phage terminase small subunit P27 family [Vibrio vulnificus]|uniref:phage terminase small subunit P27 family n=1 Tax=Vibrio parahaemolyticus TaxID=670 RepID=UPI00111FAD16|nr:phage terminase small subunit P27 family [Vibrio parahaemolyticus]EGR2700594.1 phage terminase small subunit P27 family [Vibrio parahaemolyticus]EIU6870668.1 phage terminase small subunit P27 family [Vibrio parahaemolyticus]EKH9212904.1 phage terminase small subunit P27 family [Vibrio parahaemolyticus]MBD6967796.1 phage terminase small subunit P27 family [Vibrio parahaemolyticus]MBD6971981.1 phage terminase small subunit P27 family [Vibrio parahaemolyticus]